MLKHGARAGLETSTTIERFSTLDRLDDRRDSPSIRALGRLAGTLAVSFST
ncbi:MAG: hypothetical protein IH945_01855 [Armatimonadetes bacterium]|nr:hypothetical protein [Armatimonadota bacterium]